MERTVEKMIFKPAEHYDQWFPMAVDLLIPIFVQLRQSMGIAVHLVPDGRANVLQLSGRVRRWTPAQGHLRLTPAEVKAFPQLKLMLETELKQKEQWPLVRKEKQVDGGRRVMFWILDGPRLAKALGK